MRVLFFSFLLVSFEMVGDLVLMLEGVGFVTGWLVVVFLVVVVCDFGVLIEMMICLLFVWMEYRVVVSIVILIWMIEF